MRFYSSYALTCLLGTGLLAACQPAAPPPSIVSEPSRSPTEPSPFSALDRATLHRAAVRLNLPLYWVEDRNANQAVDPDEIVSLLFYPTAPPWVQGGALTRPFAEAYDAMRAWAGPPPLPSSLSPEERARRLLVVNDLDQGIATLVHTDLRNASETDREFVRRMIRAASLIDRIYARQRGLDAFSGQVPADDLASQSLFRRNWGPRCVAPKTAANPACSAIPGAPAPVSGVYPPRLQKNANLCEQLEKRPDAQALLRPFVVLQEGRNGDVQPVSFAEVYGDLMKEVATELRAAAQVFSVEEESALQQYLRAAAQSFVDNDWNGADEAWARMNAVNSKWYLRVAPDEVYWSPCHRTAGFHMSFARINSDSLRWQRALGPLQQQMEQRLADHIGSGYRAREVTFHLPDFVEIVLTAGDSRDALGATLGQSLPNWGPVANEGRGRTVAMTNLYTDSDSRRIERAQAESLLTASSMHSWPTSAEPRLLTTILHEATHNLGPSHEYRVAGKTDDEAFGGALATVMEELKAQTGSFWFTVLVREAGVVSAELAAEMHVDSIFWSLQHIARGMYEDNGRPRPYSQLAAIQVGTLIDAGALRWDPDATAANGRDRGAFELDLSQLETAMHVLMARVGAIKASADRRSAEALIEQYVKGKIVPFEAIADRVLRYPKANFVYAVDF